MYYLLRFHFTHSEDVSSLSLDTQGLSVCTLLMSAKMRVIHWFKTWTFPSQDGLDHCYGQVPNREIVETGAQLLYDTILWEDPLAPPPLYPPIWNSF